MRYATHKLKKFKLLRAIKYFLNKFKRARMLTFKKENKTNYY